MECTNCGVSDSNIQLFDVISGEGIVKLCKNCLSSENVRLNRPGGVHPGKEKKQTTYERLSSLAGIKDPQKHKKNIFGKDKNEEMKKQEVTLRDLVDKKFDKFVKEEVKKRDDLIDNFHWVIMRARRSKKMSVSQLARQIQEPEKVVKNAEQGILPDDYDVVIKLENALGINLLRPGVAEMIERQPKKLGFDDVTAKTLTISDLKEMKKDDPGVDVDVDFDPEAGVFKKKKKGPYWKKALSKIMSRRKKAENEIVFKEIDKSKISAEASESTHQSSQLTESKYGSGFDSEQASKEKDTAGSDSEYGSASLEMTTSFSGQNEEKEKRDDAEGKHGREKKRFADKSEKEKKEMSQQEIDDLIFGRQ